MVDDLSLAGQDVACSLCGGRFQMPIIIDKRRPPTAPVARRKSRGLKYLMVLATVVWIGGMFAITIAMTLLGVGSFEHYGGNIYVGAGGSIYTGGEVLWAALVGAFFLGIVIPTGIYFVTMIFLGVLYFASGD